MKTSLSTKDVRLREKQFPNGSTWSKIELPDPDKSIRWALEEACGVYVFAIPSGSFKFTRPIILHGKNNHKFEYSAKFESFKHGKSQFDVLYVGKTSNLSRRLPLHFRESAKTGHQVVDGMRKVKGSTFSKQRDWLLKNCTLFFNKLQFDGESGDGYFNSKRSRAADRDLLELSLIAKFAPPFNIKAER